MFGRIALVDIGTDVFADAGRDIDVEATFGRNLKKLSRLVLMGIALTVERHTAGTGDDFHPFGGACSKMVTTSIDKTEGLLGAVGEDDGMADDFAIEIDVGFGEDGYLAELSGQ